MKQAVAEGWLVPARYFAPTRPDLRDAEIKRGDYDQVQLSKSMNRPKLTGDIVETWARLATDRNSVLFATNIAHSLHL
ncbi:MAG: hypothetical protein M3120_10560 [Pseudomonadota bacterium]|nr:hypothetical protein [Pseudomonadota bacterium]